MVRGDLAQRDFLGFYLQDEHIRAVVSINRAKELRLAMRLIKAQLPLQATVLADQAVPLRSLLPRSG